MKEQGNVNYGDDGGSRSYSIQIDVAEIVRSRYTSLINLRFTVQWIYASLVAHLYLLYEDTRMRYSTLLYYYSTSRRRTGVSRCTLFPALYSSKIDIVGAH